MSSDGRGESSLTALGLLVAGVASLLLGLRRP
jgi:hypothetical protein